MLDTFIIAMWASVAVTLYFQEFTRLHLKIRIRNPRRYWGKMIAVPPGHSVKDLRYWHPFNRKPFNCEVCLPFWLFAAFLPFAIYWCIAVAFIAAACTVGIITPLIIKAIRK